MPHLFDPITLRGLTLKNRIMMSPMCQYSAGKDAAPNDWHLVHYPTRAVGGAGLIMVEATAVESRGRLSQGDLGIYEERHIEPFSRIVDLCHKNGSKIGIQLAHAGRKAWSDDKGFGPEEPVAPSAILFDEGWKAPHALTVDEIRRVVANFQSAARRALQAGFDAIELHAAHGYLINEFLSPLSNYRQDEYGGSRQGRVLFLNQILDSVRKVWPDASPLFVRLSASDYLPGGIDVEETVEIARILKGHGVDLIDCSSGGVVPAPISAGPGYQVPFAYKIKHEAKMPTAAVGIITTAELAEEIIRNERADLVVLGRELLRHPYWPLDAAAQLKKEVEWPVQYIRAKR
ncbi:MAG: NADPH dehydrogenase NamA [Chloroflexi bacterium]|nr:NADPH dehydrogenase NamA [Chloroflexota bacterium]